MVDTSYELGFPLMAGFMSKDEILWWAFASERGSTVAWALVVLAAVVMLVLRIQIPAVLVRLQRLLRLLMLRLVLLVT